MQDQAARVAEPTTEPTAETIDEASQTPPEAPQFDIVRVDTDGGLTLAGEGRAGFALDVLLDGEVLATLTPGADGSFAHLGKLPASNTARILSLREVESGILGASEFVVAPLLALTAEQGEPASSQTTVQTTAQTAQAVVQISKDGAEVVQPAAAPELLSEVAIDAITYSEQGDVQLSGRAPREGHVRVYLNNRPVKTQPVQNTGVWRTELPDVDTGVYTLRVDQVDASGAVTSRVETPFKREEPAKLQAAQVTAVTVQPGATLWAIAAERFGNGTQYVQLYEANKDRIRDPDLIYPGQVFDLPTE
ncbi:LysM peptidoglycan-binding domain-containing protein [Lentibacter algarum]|nr:LysM peptidoglycan-binding domain-containing protein [Lentibacter algarum]